jgi:hypothetical protein
LSANPPRHAERLTSARILFSDARHSCCRFVAAIIVTGLKLAGVPVPLIDYPVGSFGKGKGPNGDITIQAPGFNNPDAVGQYALLA